MALVEPWVKWWVGVFPSANSIQDINPDLRVYRKRQRITVNHDGDVATEMGSKGFLDVEKIVFIVHGFTNTGDEPWITEMKNALLEVEDLTVVVVAWGGGANLFQPNYCQASSNTRTVGPWLGECIRRIKAKKPNLSLHGIGHSLGAHVLGMAGRASKQLDRISGLDPAGPDFEPGSVGYKAGLRGLCKTDAKNMVDVIHTCCYTTQKIALGPYHFGKFEAMGTVDFYPNWGYMQPGTVWDWNPLGAKKLMGASHKRAYELFTWSIKYRGKLTTNQALTEQPSNSNLTPKCNALPDGKVVEMGFYTSARGLYYIEITAEAEPWK